MNLEPDISTLHIYQGCDLFHRNDFESALVEFDMSLALDENPYARFNRSLTLLALGRYPEGFADYHTCWQIFRSELTDRGKQFYFQRRRPVWQGEPYVRLVLLHEAGYGDGIQMLRFVPLVQEIAPLVSLEMPPALQRLASQVAPVQYDDEDADFICPMFRLMNVLKQTIETIPPPPYLVADPDLQAQWARRIGNGGRRRVGITWSVKLTSEHEHPNAKREIPLDDLVAGLNLVFGLNECEFYSLQTQDREEADARGVRTFEFVDFADVAALASLLDAIVSIDTAALHVAGAIGHPQVYGLLPFAATWRWLHGNWYPQVKLCQQESPGDWSSCFARMSGLL